MLIYILAAIVAVIIGLYFIVDKKVSAQKELVINKNIDDVWEIMGTQFDQVHLWSTNFKESKAGGSAKFSSIPYSERITRTDRGETIQELDSFDPTTHTLTYHITKGAPGIAKHASAVWSLESSAENETTVILAFKMEAKGFLGYMMMPLIKKGMGNSALEIAEDLKHYAENGTPHPRKVKSQQN